MQGTTRCDVAVDPNKRRRLLPSHYTLHVSVHSHGKQTNKKEGSSIVLLCSSSQTRSNHPCNLRCRAILSDTDDIDTCGAAPTVSAYQPSTVLRACLAGLRLLQKRLRLLWWSGFSGGAGAVLQNVWQNSFTC